MLAATDFTTATFIALMTLLLLFAGTIIGAMKLYSMMTSRITALEVQMQRLIRIHNGHEEGDHG